MSANDAQPLIQSIYFRFFLSSTLSDIIIIVFNLMFNQFTLHMIAFNNSQLNAANVVVYTHHWEKEMENDRNAQFAL